MGVRDHLEQSETTMMEEAHAAATRFRCSGTRGLPCTARATGMGLSAKPLSPVLHSRPRRPRNHAWSRHSEQ